MKQYIQFFLLLGAMMMAGVTTAQADNYAYLTFEQTDGTKTSIAVSSLSTITIGSTTLTAGSTTFTLTNLSKMYFSAGDEATGIADILTDGIQATDVQVYTLSGTSMGTFGSISTAKESLPAGIYILKTNGKSLKVTVK